MLPVGGKIQYGPAWAIACSDLTATLPCMALEPWLSFQKITSSLNPLSVSKARHSINDYHSCSAECSDSNREGTETLGQSGTHSLPPLKALGLNFRVCSQCHMLIPLPSCLDNLVNQQRNKNSFFYTSPLCPQKTTWETQNFSLDTCSLTKHVTFLWKKGDIYLFFLIPEAALISWQSSCCVEAEDVTHDNHELL